MRFLLCLVLCFLSAASYAKPFFIITETSIANDNWHPLPVRDMKAAAGDTALAEFSSNGRFEAKPASEASRQQHDGKLQLDISLIGPAEVVKLTMSLHLKDNASYVSSVSMDISGMDYQGIYDAFEYVGREAAKRLNTKIAMAHADEKDAPKNQTKSKTATAELVSTYNRAQSLKRQEKFHEARVLFQNVIDMSAEAEQRWSEMATDELRYGLPIFEADNLLLNNALQNPLLLKGKMEKVEHLYRQILANNTDKPLRVVEMNKRLDNISISRKAMANALKASALSGAIPLRMMLREYYMTRGEWPDQAEMKQQILGHAPNFDLVSYQSNNEQIELVVKDKKYGAEIQLAGNGQGITAQLK